jgi:hypothetical protein
MLYGRMYYLPLVQILGMLSSTSKGERSTRGPKEGKNGARDADKKEINPCRIQTVVFTGNIEYHNMYQVTCPCKCPSEYTMLVRWVRGL